MQTQNMFVQVKLKGQAEEGIDLEKERHKLAQLFDRTLKMANLGHWTGSALRSDETLIIYFLANDEALASETIINCFEEYEIRSEFETLVIQRV